MADIKQTYMVEVTIKSQDMKKCKILLKTADGKFFEAANLKPARP